eukprot:jgi/Ulvmu1/7144/UM034_0050.1
MTSVTCAAIDLKQFVPVDLTKIDVAGHSMGRSANYASHRHQHRPYAAQPSLSQASTNNRVSDAWHSGRDRVRLSLRQKSPDRHRSRSSRREPGHERRRSSADARQPEHPATPSAPRASAPSGHPASAVPAAKPARRRTADNQPLQGATGARSPAAPAANAQQAHARPDSAAPRRASQAQAPASHHAMPAPVQPAAQPMPQPVSYPASQDAAAAAYYAYAAQYHGQYDAHDAQHVQPYAASPTLLAEPEIPNYEALDVELDAILPDEPAYEEPQLRPLPPLGIHAPASLTASPAAPLCWDWPAAETLQEDAPTQAREPATAVSGERKPWDPNDGVWVNPGAATDHAWSASRAAAAFMAPLMPPPAAHPAGQSADTAATCSGAEAAPALQPASPKTADAPAHPAAAAAHVPDVSAAPAAVQAPAAREPAAATSAVAAAVAQVVPHADPHAVPHAVPPAVPHASAASTAAAAVDDEAPAASADVKGARLAPAVMEGVVAGTLPIAAHAATAAPPPAAVAPEREAVKPPAEAPAAETGPPDSPLARDPPHPAERSEDAPMQQSGRMYIEAPGAVAGATDGAGDASAPEAVRTIARQRTRHQGKPSFGLVEYASSTESEPLSMQPPAANGASHQSAEPPAVVASAESQQQHAAALPGGSSTGPAPSQAPAESTSAPVATTSAIAPAAHAGRAPATAVASQRPAHSIAPEPLAASAPATAAPDVGHKVLAAAPPAAAPDSQRRPASPKHPNAVDAAGREAGRDEAESDSDSEVRLDHANEAPAAPAVATAGGRAAAVRAAARPRPALAGAAAAAPAPVCSIDDIARMLEYGIDGPEQSSPDDGAAPAAEASAPAGRAPAAAAEAAATADAARSAAPGPLAAPAGAAGDTAADTAATQQGVAALGGQSRRHPVATKGARGAKGALGALTPAATAAPPAAAPLPPLAPTAPPPHQRPAQQANISAMLKLYAARAAPGSTATPPQTAPGSAPERPAGAPGTAAAANGQGAVVPQPQGLLVPHAQAALRPIGVNPAQIPGGLVVPNGVASAAAQSALLASLQANPVIRPLLQQAVANGTTAFRPAAPGRAGQPQAHNGTVTAIRPTGDSSGHSAGHSAFSRINIAPTTMRPQGAAIAPVRSLVLPPAVPMPAQQPQHAAASASSVAAAAAAALSAAGNALRPAAASQPLWSLPVASALATGPAAALTAAPPLPAVYATPTTAQPSAPCTAIAGPASVPTQPAAAAAAFPAAPLLHAAAPHAPSAGPASPAAAPAAAPAPSIFAPTATAAPSLPHLLRTLAADPITAASATAPATAAPQRSSRTQLPPSGAVPTWPRPLVRPTPKAPSQSALARTYSADLVPRVPTAAAPAPPASAATANSSELPPAETPHGSSIIRGFFNSTELDRMVLGDEVPWETSPTFSLASLGPLPTDASIPFTARPASVAAAGAAAEEHGPEADSTISAEHQPCAAVEVAALQQAKPVSVPPAVSVAVEAAAPAAEQSAQASLARGQLAAEELVREEPEREDSETAAEPEEGGASVVAAPQAEAAPRTIEVVLPKEPLHGPTAGVDVANRAARLQSVPFMIVPALQPFFPTSSTAPPAGTAPPDAGPGGRLWVRPAVNFAMDQAQAVPGPDAVARRRSKSLAELAETAVAGGAGHRAAAAAAADASATVTVSPFKMETPPDGGEVSSSHARERSTSRRKRVASSSGVTLYRPQARMSATERARSVFMPDGPLEEGAAVVYYDARTDETLLEGSVSLATLNHGTVVEPGGILCSHCNEVISVTSFEAHAGRGKRRSGFDHVYLVQPDGTYGATLRDVVNGIDDSEDLELPRVLGMPRAQPPAARAHAKTMRGGRARRAKVPAILQPRGERVSTGREALQRNDQQVMWEMEVDGLPFSEDEDSEETAAEEAEAGGRAAAVVVEGDALADTLASGVARTLAPPLVAPPEAAANHTDPGACMLCFSPDFVADEDDFGDRTVLVCESCEREYHVGCLREAGLCNLTQLPKGDWFCSRQCQCIRNAVIEKHMAGPWSVPASQGEGYTVQLVMGSRTPKPPRARRTMREGLAVLREGFDPIIDDATERDLAELMVLGRVTDGDTFNFVNMTTAVLRLDGMPVVAAVVRVSGPILAEIPLIATRRTARRRGHARVLLDGLASWLSGLGVDQIMLPAHDDALDTWVSGFGFVRATQEELAFIKRHLVFVMFPSTTVLKLPADAAARPPLPPRRPLVTPAEDGSPAAATEGGDTGGTPVEGERVRIKLGPARKQRQALAMPVAARQARTKQADAAGEGTPGSGGDGADALPSLRPRRDVRRSYADVENGLLGFDEADGVANGRESSRGHRRSSAGADVGEMKSKFGRTVKRPRYADEAIDGLAARAPEPKRVRAVSTILARGLDKLGHDSGPAAAAAAEEPAVPAEWRNGVSGESDYAEDEEITQ